MKHDLLTSTCVSQLSHLTAVSKVCCDRSRTSELSVVCVVGESISEESLHLHSPVIKLKLLMKTSEEFDHSVSSGHNSTTRIHREDYSSAKSSCEIKLDLLILKL